MLKTKEMGDLQLGKSKRQTIPIAASDGTNLGQNTKEKNRPSSAAAKRPNLRRLCTF